MPNKTERKPRLHVDYVHLPCGLKVGQAFELASQRFVIGRAAQSDLVVDDPTVSRQHAEVICEAERWFLVDAGSQNGTFHNTERLAANKHQPLKDGDRIQIGSLFVLRFEDPSATMNEPTRLILSPGLSLDLARRDAYLRRRKLAPPLTTRQFRLLEILVKHNGEIVSKDQMANLVWPEARGGVTDQMMDNLVARLRQRLGQLDDGHEYIERLRGVGLRFVQRE